MLKDVLSRGETLRRRQHSNEGAEFSNDFPSKQKIINICVFFGAASLESSRYLVLSITATVVFLVLKDWSEEVVLFLSRAVKILTQTITLPKFNMEPKSDGFQKESLIPGCHFQIIFRIQVKLWEVIQKSLRICGDHMMKQGDAGLKFQM